MKDLHELPSLLLRYVRPSSFPFEEPLHWRDERGRIDP